MIKKAFIPAAGLGKRLGEQTRSRPKALVEVKGIAMLELTIQKLKKAGIQKFLVNVHHFSDQVISFLREHNHFDADITISDETEMLLDTGGAVKKAQAFFEGKEPVLVHNVDVVSDIDLKKLEGVHHSKNALVTLSVRDRDSSRKLLFDDEMRLVGWKHITKGEFKWAKAPVDGYMEYAFSGIYLASAGFAAELPMTGKFSIIDAWLKMADKNNIQGYLDDSANWFDLGTPDKLRKAEAFIDRLNSDRK
jgi:NDP-sugar pyrophosphorylase family protein